MFRLYKFDLWYNPFLSNWDETLIFRWLNRRKFVNFPKTDK